MPICPHNLCTGTHYLADSPELGACPSCCTPEAMQRLDRTVAALTAPKPFSEQLDELEGMVSTMRDTYRGLEIERDDALEAVADATAALQGYLSESGHTSAPVTLPPGALRGLCETLGLL